MPPILAVVQLVEDHGSSDFSYVLRLAVLFAVMGLYWLWLSSPRAGAYEALITKNAAQAVPLALLVGPRPATDGGGARSSWRCSWTHQVMAGA